MRKRLILFFALVAVVEGWLAPPHSLWLGPSPVEAGVALRNKAQAGAPGAGTIQFRDFKSAGSGGAATITFPAVAGNPSIQQAVGNNSSFNVTIPSGASAGDFAVLIIAGRPSDTSEPSAPTTQLTPWILRSSKWVDVAGTNNDLKIMTFYRVLISGDAGLNVTVSLPGGWANVNKGMSGQIAVWRGVDTTTPFDTVADVTGSSAASQTWTPPSIATVTNGAWVVSAVATSDDNRLDIPTPQGFTGRMQGVAYSTLTGGHHSVGLADVLQATAGTPTMLTWRQTVNGNDTWAGITFALRPAAGPTSLTINRPPLTAANDVMVASIGIGANTPTITPPDASWNLVPALQINNLGPNPNALAVYWKLAGDAASDPGPYTWTFSSSTGAAGGIVSFSGVDTVSTVQLDSGQPTASSLTHATPSLNPTSANVMLVASFTFNSSATWGAVSGMTQAFTQMSQGAGANGQSTAVYWAPQTLTNPPLGFGPYSATASGVDADAGNTHILALRPADQTSLTISKPSGTAQNDVMIASIGFRASVADMATVLVTLPTNDPGNPWQEVKRMNNNNDNIPPDGTAVNSLAVYWKRAGASEPASYTWSFSASGRFAGGILSFSGVDTTGDPINGIQDGAKTPYGLNHATPAAGITTTVANMMLVTSFSYASAATWTAPSPSAPSLSPLTMNEAVDVAGGVESIEVNWVIQAAAGNTGVYTAIAADDADGGNAHILALRPLQCSTVANASYLAATATPGAPGTVTLRWFPTTSPVVILRMQGTFGASDAPTPGQGYANYDPAGAGTTATVVFAGSGGETSFTDTSGLSNNNTYNYRVFPRDATYCYATGAGTDVTGRPVDSTGKERWAYMGNNGSVLGMPTTDDSGNVYVGSNAGRIISLSGTTAIQNWSPFTTTLGVQGYLVWTTLSAGGTPLVFGGDQSGTVYAVNSSNGTTSANFAAVANASGGAVSSLTYALTVPAGADRFLIVSVQLGSDCAAAVPTVSGVTYAGVALTPITSIVGVPCGGGTRSEQWQLVAPATGTNNVVVTLSGATSFTIHSGAMTFTGVNQTTPVRAFASASGATASSTVTVTSAVGDMVVNTVGQGNSLTAPGGGQTQRFRNNVSTGNTLNNSGGSTAPGAASSVTMTWTFGAADQWQTISSSLQPSASASSGWQVTPTGSTAIQAGVSVQLRVWSNSAFATAYPGTYDVVFAATSNASTTNNKVFALRSDTGATLWTFPLVAQNVDQILGQPWIDYARNRLYVASKAGGGAQSSLWVIDSRNGSIITSFNTLGQISTAPTQSYDTNTVWVGNENGDIYAINVAPATPVLKWAAPLALGSSKKIKGYVWEDYSTAGRLYFTTNDGTVTCFQDPGAGATPSTASACSGGWLRVSVGVGVAGATTVLLLDKIYVGSWNGTTGTIVPIVPATGAAGTAFPVGDGTRAVGDMSTVTGAELLIGTTEGKIFKISLPLP